MKLKPITRISIYSRVSSDLQSHESQLREVRAYVKRRWPHAKVSEYLDRISGTQSSRVGLDALMAEVRKGKVDVVAIFKLDRLGRSLQHLMQVISELRRHRTALVTSSQGIDTSEENPVGSLQWQILGAVAEFESTIFRDRVRAGQAAAKANGTRLGRPPVLNRYVDAAQ